MPHVCRHLGCVAAGHDWPVTGSDDRPPTIGRRSLSRRAGSARVGAADESISMDMVPAVREPACTACAGPVVVVAWTQLPLLRHAGYGEAQRTRIEQCVTAQCGSVRPLGVESISPLVAARA